MTYFRIKQPEAVLLDESNSSARTDFAEAGISAANGHRLVPLLVWLGVVLTLILIPLKIVSYGYLPPDDALRHAAKAVSGRDWSEILVIQDQFKMDHNPGWHWILTRVHEATGSGTDALVVFSVSALTLLFLLTPLGWIRRPEAWIATLLISVVVYPGLFYRVLLGRPFALSIISTLVLLFLWQKREKPSISLLGISTVLFALATWLHGSWYLFSLLVAAFALGGQWRASLWLGGCWLIGSFLGALLTGHPFGFLWNAINIGLNCFGQHQLQRMLVAEFLPSDGAPIIVALALGLLIIRALTGNWTWTAVRNPPFILFTLGWMLGFRVIRFEADWALPALTLWIALELQEHFGRLLPVDSFRRLIMAGGLCATLFLATTGDLGGRWTNNLANEYLSENDPEMKPWLPEDGGTIYSADMAVFYQTFYKNPHANWKYILGFESTFMPPEDLKIHRNIQWNFYAHKAYEPWVAKMRPEDRMIIRSSSSTAPAVQGLEWKYVARETWIGRVPRNFPPESKALPKE